MYVEQRGLKPSSESGAFTMDVNHQDISGSDLLQTPGQIITVTICWHLTKPQILQHALFHMKFWMLTPFHLK